ncbi:MAG: vitamin K epoxide reductase family protein [Patescibacteria group bacterium]
MNNSKSGLRRALANPSVLAALAVGVGVIGFADSTYLTFAHYTGATLPCTIVHGCDTVTKSAYALFFGIPVALFGVAYYLTIIISAIAYLDSKKEAFLIFLASFTIVGLLASAWFVFLQVAVIGALCIYCLASAVTSTILFALGARLKMIFQK